MMLFLYEIIRLALSPLRIFRTRARILEVLLGINISEVDFASVQRCCSESRTTIGEYYYWKAALALQIQILRLLPSGPIFELVERLHLCRADPGIVKVPCAGSACIYAIPHHGPFVLSIISLANSLRRDRHVCIFYDPPGKNPANIIFDGVWSKLYGEGSSVSIVHNDRAGVAAVMRALRQGAAVIIMPDVFDARAETYQVPFLGRSRSVMLGSASLARRTGALLVPTVAVPIRNGFYFQTIFGHPINPYLLDVSVENSDFPVTTWIDFKSTARIFQEYEELMVRDIIYWQYCASHRQSPAAAVKIESAQVPDVSRLFLSDPRANISFASPAVLDRVSST